MGTVIGMFGLIAGGTENAIASIDVPADGFLIGVDWDVMADLDADTESTMAELSFGSTGNLTTNDTRSRISTCTGGVVAAGGTPASLTPSGGSKYVSLPDLPVGIGERIYLHALSGASLSGTVRCNLHFTFNLDRAMTRRR